MLKRIGGFALGLVLFAALTVLGVPAAPAAQAASGVAYVQGAAFGTGTQFRPSACRSPNQSVQVSCWSAGSPSTTRQARSRCPTV